jgi:hypothetical protein
MSARRSNDAFLLELGAQGSPHAARRFDLRGKQMSGGDDGGEIGDQMLAGTATSEMGTRRGRHGHKTLLLEDDFYFFTLHGR